MKTLRWRRIGVFLVLLWLARAAAIIALADPMESPDTTQHYVPLAHNLWEGRGFSIDRFPPYVPTAWRTPGYPIFLALTFSPWPEYPHLAILLHILLEGAAIWFFYRTIFEISGTRFTADLATLLFIAWPYNIETNGIFHREPLFVPVMTFAYCFFLRAVARKNLRWLACSGAAFGLAVHFREDGLYFWMIFLGAWAWIFRREPFLQKRGGGALVIPLVLLLSPWVARNIYTFHRPILIQHSPVSILWVLGNVDGWKVKSPGESDLLPVLSAADRTHLQNLFAVLDDLCNRNGHPDRWRDLGLEYRAVAWKYLHAYPARYARLVATHLFRYLFSSRLDDLPGDMKSRGIFYLSALFHSLLYIGGIAGCWLVRRNRYLIAVIFFPVLSVAIIGNLKGRYELPIFPLLFLGTAQVVTMLRRQKEGVVIPLARAS